MNSQTSLSSIKKSMHVALVLLLIIFSIGPIPVRAADQYLNFQGSVTPAGKTISVILNDDTETYGITLHKRVSDKQNPTDNQIGSPIRGNKAEFTGLDYGVYYVIAVNEDRSKSYKSSDYALKPNPPVITQEEPNSRNLKVSQGVPGNDVFLQHQTLKSMPPFQNKFDELGIALFLNLPAGQYLAQQSGPGGVSEWSSSMNSITIRPESPTAIVIQEPGSSDLNGKIQVNDIISGNSIKVVKGTETIKTCTPQASTSFICDGLKAGIYEVYQVENGIESKNPVSIILKDQRKPIIMIDNEVNFPAEKEYIYPFKFETLPITAKDQKENAITGNKLKISGIPPTDSRNLAVPGKYEILISAEDNLGNISEAKQTLTILPPTIGTNETGLQNSLIESLDTLKNDPNNDGTGKFGSIIIKDHESNYGLYPGATLYLYKEPKVVIQKIENINVNNFKFDNVPVGDNYYVVQVFGGIPSEPSFRIDIKDDTPPKLTLNGADPYKMTVGSKYEELGATATDNITPSASHNIVIDNSNVDSNTPGTYTVTYNTKDEAGIPAAQITRTVLVQPAPVSAIGSNADIGEIGVTNIFPTSGDKITNLTLYKYNAAEKKFKIAEEIDLLSTEYAFKMPMPIPTSETTAVFRKFKPGLYYVIQTVNGQSSPPSNTVEIIDIDKPFITMTGSDHYSFVWSQAQSPYFTGGNEFTDPGVTAKDYIDGNLTAIVEKQISPDVTIDNTSKKVTFPAPGKYIFTYNVSASRGVKAEEKIRTVTVAPNSPTAVSTIGHNEITVNNLFIKRAQDNVSVTLYDPYGVALTTIPTASSSATFSDVKAGLGYTVTQTVNGIESSHSSPVDISIHPDAGSNIYFSTFKLAGIPVTPVIDHTARTIKFTVPATTNLAALTPIYTIESDKIAVPIVKVGDAIQTSNSSEQDFTSPVVYKLLDNTTILKSYTVSVVKSANASVFWKDTVLLNTNLTSSSQSLELTSSQKATASKNGVSYLSNNQIIHMSALSVSMNNDAQLAARKLNASQVLRTGDPSWAASLSEVMEITSASSSKFAQPLEIEQTSSSDKVLAKLVRENGKLYAIQMPSKTLRGKTIGLVPEPGLYALVTPATPPVFLNSGDGKYKLISGFGGVIHYTDSSKSIQFIRSSNSNELGADLPKESPTTLNSWKQYLPGTEVSSENGELFAFSMKDQFISPIRSIEAAPPSEWKPTIQRVEANKIWHVTFNARIDLESLRNNPIRVTDSGGNPVAVNSVISNNGRTIDIVPIVPYDRGEIYTLWVDKELKGNTIKKEYLKKAVKLTFQIK